MPSVLIFATAATIIAVAIIAIFIHHGLTHPDEPDFFKRWLDSEDFMAAFEELGASHGGVVLALLILLIGVVI